MDGCILQSSLLIKFLGIIFDTNIEWGEQVDVDTFLAARLCDVYLVLPAANVLWLAYVGFLESRLKYGVIFWGFFRQDLFNRIYRLQKRALKVVWGLCRRDECRGRL